ncbi:hypothetical protein NXS19_000878 [Fusarium pseudograminearum]|nr:hypothetical protein NXS19_000878 [Fusarium pseudograminearum]
MIFRSNEFIIDASQTDLSASSGSLSPTRPEPKPDLATRSRCCFRELHRRSNSPALHSGMRHRLANALFLARYLLVFIRQPYSCPTLISERKLAMTLNRRLMGHSRDELDPFGSSCLGHDILCNPCVVAHRCFS